MLAAAWAEPPEAEVVVVQAPNLSLESATPASVTVIEIDERIPEGADLAAVVGSASGVAVSRLGGLGDFASVSIRGSTGRQVTVYLDGVPLNPDGIGSIDLSDLPMRSFERVEVWRGNAPVGLGGTSMGGAVQLVTSEEPATSFAVTAGSWTTARLRGLVSRPTSFGDVWVSGQYLSTLGRYPYFDDRGTRFEPGDDSEQLRENNDTRVGSGNLRLRVEGDRWRLSFLDSLLAREEGVPGFIGAPTERVRYSAVRNLGVVQLDTEGAVPLRVRLHGRRRVERLLDPALELGTGDSTTRISSLGADIQGSWAPTSWAKLDSMGSVAVDVFGAEASRVVGRAHLGGSLWAMDHRLVAVPVLSAVGLRSKGVGDAAKGAVLPRLGLMWRLSERVQLRANAGRYFRPPDPTELFGNRGALAGRPDLRSESGTQLDLGLRVEADAATVVLGGFQAQSTDLIVYVQNAQQVAVPTNLGRTVTRGLEGVLTIHGFSWLDWQTNGTLTQSLNLEAPFVGNSIPRIPLLQIDQRTAVLWRGARFGHSFSFTSGTFTDAPNFNQLAPRPLHGLFARLPIGGEASVDFDILNLFDLRTQRVPANPLDPDSPAVSTAIADFVGYPLPGRTLLLTLRFDEAR